MGLLTLRFVKTDAFQENCANGVLYALLITLLHYVNLVLREVEGLYKEGHSQNAINAILSDSCNICFAESTRQTPSKESI